MKTQPTPLIEIQHFIQAIRDAGYKGTSAAIAELIDNSLEAKATQVRIDIVENDQRKVERIKVTDDGCGMIPAEMKVALQFGGSSRFGSTQGTGRYGMGLPNSSVSQAKRVDLYSWVNEGAVYRTFLDIDEIITGNCKEIIEPTLVDINVNPLNGKKGTVVEWSRCDRLSLKEKESLAQLLKSELGRIFRKQIWLGKKIFVNDQIVLPVDPLFLNAGNNLRGALIYGDNLRYDIKLPGSLAEATLSRVEVVFSELPVAKWHLFSNKEKREHSISKNRGISIVRADREIDNGWYFMGNKRKENYDDWWRCEVSFSPELDEMFGVTHTKQGINPSVELLNILSPDMEATAHRLNSRVRSKFIKIKDKQIKSSERRAEKYDVYLSPPSVDVRCNNVQGLKYKILVADTGTTTFYKTDFDIERISVILNEQHPFFQKFYAQFKGQNNGDYRTLKTYFEILLLAAARAEYQMESVTERRAINTFKEFWSDVLAAYTI